jgi:F420-non-reducing hydrogenase iron-sulfur subunit
MTADSRWQIADSKSPMPDGELQTAAGREPSAIGHPPSATYIVAFCCHYCAYAAADLAGSLRIQYPPSVRVVKLPCTGKLDVQGVLEAFEHGADGVMVAGCLEGDCHYQMGNFNAKRRVNHVKTLLRQIGFEPDRVRMFNMSSAMGQKWAEAVAEMDETVRQLGPSPLRKSSG